ncbi:uncharacterized protein LOC107267844 [Cephus cinctus]|uniref:Uncharacterized protein LOC107267844 n=1 Tax=Cephus cinctus TaxID=211228 RepID=A0AAJ7RHC9_CEPCN|nr:uncharacterized protein LOC107267844 [Cephus cinctus]
MPCKCDPSRKYEKECGCRRSPGGHPSAAVNCAKCLGPKAQKYIPQIPAASREERSERVDIRDDIRRPCVSMVSRKRAPCARPISQRTRKSTCPAQKSEQPPKLLPPCMKSDKRERPRPEKKIKKKSSSPRDVVCVGGKVVKVPCGVANVEEDTDAPCDEANRKIYAMEKTLSKTRWEDEEGHHMTTVTMGQIYQPDGQGGGRTCASDKRRNYLKAKLRELVGESQPIPEVLPEGVESKPEPEVVAAALLMSESEGSDLSKAKPGNIFHKLFYDQATDKSVAIASAVPEPMSDMVVPVRVQGNQAVTLDIPNIQRIVKKAGNASVPNPNLFLISTALEKIPEASERSPDAVSQFIGVTSQGKSNGAESQDLITEYVIRPEPPAYRNRCQLNGSVRPSWFPGFVVVSPSLPGHVRLSADPGEALRDAWRLCRPHHFDELSKSLVNTG